MNLPRFLEMRCCRGLGRGRDWGARRPKRKRPPCRVERRGHRLSREAPVVRTTQPPRPILIAESALDWKRNLWYQRLCLMHGSVIHDCLRISGARSAKMRADAGFGLPAPTAMAIHGSACAGKGIPATGSLMTRWLRPSRKASSSIICAGTRYALTPVTWRLSLRLRT